MKVKTKGMKIVCYRDERTTVELANGRMFDGNKAHLRSLRGEVLASPVGCELFKLPPTVDLRLLENAELFGLEKVAKKLRKPATTVADYCRRFKIGSRFGGEKMLTEGDVARLKDKLAKPKTKNR